MTARSSRAPLLILFALLAALAVPTAIVLSAGSDSVSTYRHASSMHPVMPGHGRVMPTDVHPTARAGQLVVDVGDYWFKPTTRRMRAGRYQLVVHSYAYTAHDVMVERMPIKFSGPGQPVDEAAPYGVDGLMPGMHKSASMVLGPGRWEVFCSVGGHYMAGQHFELDVYGHLPRTMNEQRHGMGDDEEGGPGIGPMDGQSMGGGGSMM